MAQEQSRDRPKYGSVHLGPFYLSLRVPFAAGVDSNVYNTPDGTSDQSASLTPTLQVVLPLTRHLRIKGSGGIVPQYFHREATERYTDRFGDVRGEVDVGPITAFGGIGAGHYRQRFSLEIDDRLLRHEKKDLMGTTLHVGKRVSVSASQARVTATFDPEATVNGKPVSTSLDRRTVTRHADLSVPLTRKTSLVPFVDFIEDQFLRPTSGLKPVVSSQRYGAALSFSELAFLNGTVSAGVRHFGAGQGVAAYDGPFLAVTVSSPFIIGTRLLLNANRDVIYSAIATTPVDGALRSTYVSSGYRAEVAFELPLKLHGHVSGGYLESRYLLPPGAAPDSISRLDRGWVQGAALLRHFGRHLSLGGSVQHESRTSPVEGRSYGGMVYGLAGDLSL